VRTCAATLSFQLISVLNRIAGLPVKLQLVAVVLWSCTASGVWGWGGWVEGVLYDVGAPFSLWTRGVLILRGIDAVL